MLTPSGFISTEQKEQVLKATDIVQLIGSFVQLRASGKNFLGLCPFHQEKTPSFTVSPSHQSYKCYGCGTYGDSIRFVMDFENLKFFETIQYLADRAGITLKITKKGKKESLQQTEIAKCLDSAQLFFRLNLKNATGSSAIGSYLKQRMLSHDLTEIFQLGYVAKGWTNLHDYLNKKGISTKTQDDAGLIKKGDKGGYYDRLRDRLIFPIRDYRNRVIGFAGRIIGDGEPKYLNPPETELYKKSSVFYGISEAQDQIRKKRRVIIVEGYLDVIRLHEQSFSEAIATCGTALTAEHLNILRRFNVNDNILLFDGDLAGLKAAERSARLFIENDIDSKVVVLPDNLDPDDYFKKYSKDDFQTLLGNAKYDFEFVLDRAYDSSSSSGMEHQKTVIDDILLLAQNIKSDIKKELLLSKIAATFQIDKRTLQNKTQRKADRKEPKPLPKLGNTPVTFNREDLSQVKFMQYLMTNPQCFKQVRNRVQPEDFNHSSISRLYSRFLLLNDSEFITLKPTDFSEIFVEYAPLITSLFHHKGEYQIPHNYRPRSDETAVMLDESEELEKLHSEERLERLIKRLKNQKRSLDKKVLSGVNQDQDRSRLLSMIEKRKHTKADTVAEKRQLNHK
jgi:DNA primase